jgi:nucleoid-associated protein YgaU
MAIEFWLTSHDGKSKLRLPVNPESLSVSSPFGFEDINVNRLGEITIIGFRELKEYSFSSFFPRDYNPTYCEYTNIPRPWDVINLLERWRGTRQPCRFIVTGTLINTPVTIRELNYEPDKAGNPGDIYYSITLKEFRPVSFAKVKTSGNKASATSKPKRPSAKSTPKTYDVKKGDSLWKIAQRVYGDGSKWRQIYEANKKVIGKNPNEIKPGMKLVIP